MTVEKENSRALRDKENQTVKGAHFSFGLIQGKRVVSFEFRKEISHAADEANVFPRRKLGEKRRTRGKRLLGKRRGIFIDTSFTRRKRNRVPHL